MSIQKIDDNIRELEKQLIVINLDFLKKMTFKSQPNTNVRCNQ